MLLQQQYNLDQAAAAVAAAAAAEGTEGSTVGVQDLPPAGQVVKPLIITT
jgi:hypothetical protein